MTGGEQAAKLEAMHQLRQVLDDIADCRLSGTVCKALAYKAVEMAMQHDVQQKSDGCNVVRFERVLAAVAAWQGSLNRVGVTEAKEMLREARHVGLASRLSRLSKLRNGTAHLDLGLEETVRRLGARPSQKLIDEEVDEDICQADVTGDGQINHEK